ncbi:MAG: flavohemoglobin expression-modulating QEGLA motif protein [Planctomycetota bacterium]
MDTTRISWIRSTVEQLRRLERPVRILSSIAWPPAVKAAFFEGGAKELPSVTYRALDRADEICDEVQRALRDIHGADPIERWLLHIGESIATAARLLASVGTSDFIEYSKQLYGEPTHPLQDGMRTALELAKDVDALFSHIDVLDLGAPDPACHLSSGVAKRVEEATRERFGDAAPMVALVTDLSANAIAGPRAIRIRRDAIFTDRDVHQLIQHEAFVHVATSLNGRSQSDLPILAASHAGTTRTQEGLAVFAEFITGAMDPDRFRRLADRVLAIQMAIDGADFLEVYRFFLERTASPDQAFENARRVFRGGCVEGGVAFTKDVVYLDGLLRVLNFLRAAVAEGRTDCLLLLFCGKLDIEDIPALSHLAAAGLCRPPRFLAPWLEDRRFLVSYLTLSRFLNRIDLEAVRIHTRGLLAHTVRLDGVAGFERA